MSTVSPAGIDAHSTGVPDSGARSETRLRLALSLVLLVALVYYLWFGLTLRTIDEADGISILASRGVLEFGFPRLPSGFIYHRGFLSHYLIAGTMWLFGVNNLSIMLPHLLFAIGSLFLIYRFAADVLERPWMGLATAVLLVTLSVQTWYATGPRMYMPLQFFTLLAMYAGWRGFVEGESLYKGITVLALIAGTLSNQQGVTVALSAPLTILVVLWLRGEGWRKILSPWNVTTVLVLGASALALATYQPPDIMPPIMGHRGASPDRIGLNLSFVDWGRHVLQLERSIPYSLAFLLAGYLAFLSSLRTRLDPDRRWAYLFVFFTLGFLVFGSVVKRGGHRLTLFLIPTYALVICSGISVAVRLVLPRADTWLKMPRSGRVLVIAALVLGLGMSIAFSTLKQTSFREVRVGGQAVDDFVVESFGRGITFGGLVQDGYRLPCGYGWRCDRELARVISNVQRSMESGDQIASELPLETHYLLGQVDAWLFFPREDREYPTLEGSPRDEYVGVPIIDTVEELRRLRDGDARVWLVVTNRGDGESVRPTWDALRDLFVRYDETAEFAIYVNRR